jgi:hypothetical protein
LGLFQCIGYEKRGFFNAVYGEKGAVPPPEFCDRLSLGGKNREATVPTSFKKEALPLEEVLYQRFFFWKRIHSLWPGNGIFPKRGPLIRRLALLFFSLFLILLKGGKKTRRHIQF